MLLLKKIYYKFMSRFSFNKKTRHFAKNVLSNRIIDSGKNNKIIVIKDKKESQVIYFNNNKLALKNTRINFTGNNNSVIILQDSTKDEEFLSMENCNIVINGNNNIIKIKSPNRLSGLEISISSDNVNMSFGKNCILRESQIICWGSEKQTYVNIGDGVSIWKNFKLFVSGNSSFVMDDDCMLSYDITVWCGDGHRVLDRETGQVTNMQREPLIIGKHCWISNNVLMTKNIKLPNNTIVAMGTVVANKFKEEYTCIAGNPAKVVKHSVNWDRKNVCEI